MQQLLDLLLQHSTHSISVEPDPARMRPADVPLVVCDNSRFYAATGWQPAISLEQTLRDVLDDWRARVEDQL
jgi:GDP-4-dehydro-6-deoxy-D-mannose reductase